MLLDQQHGGTEEEKYPIRTRNRKESPDVYLAGLLFLYFSYMDWTQKGVQEVVSTVVAVSFHLLAYEKYIFLLDFHVHIRWKCSPISELCDSLMLPSSAFLKIFFLHYVSYTVSKTEFQIHVHVLLTHPLG